MDILALMAPPPSSGESGGLGSIFMSFFPILMIFLIFYVLVIRPQSRKQKELARMIDSLKQGDRVLTSGGIFGTVISDKEDGTVFVVKIADQVKVEIARTAITTVVKKAREG